ncbi:MAG: toprim domain-containing protein [Phenylobacterium sp.]|uniref:toprim domain-containing protein n=1 Tax=Phenylobacterium sp. TaxID=1871053 RepID=UPI00391A9EB4
MPELGEGRPATLHAIAAALGGEVYAGGRRASVPAPGHSAADRSVSLLLAGERLVVHSFGGAPWQDVMDDLRTRGLVDADHRLVGGFGARPAPNAAGAVLLAAERVAAARRLWAEGAPLGTASAASRHCRRRGVVEAYAVPALRAHAAAPTSVYRPGRRRAPALMAAAHDTTGALTAVEVTYLTDDGLRRRMRASRKVVGVLPPGSAVRLAPAGQEMLVAEGVFTTLAAMRLFGLPGWALLGAHNLARWTPPPDVRRVLIAADRGRVGQAAAAQLQATLGLVGLGVVVRTPPAPFGDWNDVLVERAARSVRRFGS